MNKQSDPIVFFGSGPVAAESLALLSEWADIEAVITKPQPAHHKEQFPVLALAEKLGLKVFTPNGKAELSQLFRNKPVTSRLGLVIDYGFIIDQAVIDYFPLGILNSHFSLLPEWRGADPISFAILSGQPRTGVSVMRIVAKMDEGPILSFGIYDMNGDETTPSLTNYLIELSNSLLKHDLPTYQAGTAKLIEQADIPGQVADYPVKATYSRKLNKEDGLLDWNKPAVQLEREVRAFAEWPKSRATLAGKDVVITKAHIQAGNGKPGEIWKDGKQLGIYTTDGIFVIDTLKPAGKGEMSAAAFLAGYQI